ncbi:IS21-like element helper ATPase IstB [Vibrio sp. JC009]|uniref:IS21-like element helper ATPase IstB n=1 Tax=Vibrio sp. JC009 TaxID=2912314 RepID=UPI0023B1B2ED|nr:IS21-like element helper ATPase IstB [Vibrio sp. JC009]WED22029.1 IS21-like element helper ATPase IstB [Vibrio sp. JC009]WED23236.1 IS21-like element helper ATPase IstB [Vibrio sp. JC009]WED24012.1 IS21-like element helper ATPase IstB [Vibrio sp. JC009]WED24733.1 IS21-like element helper ATPase IstB [Vibrio sp. JC009]
MSSDKEILKVQANMLRLYGLQAHWAELTEEQQQWLSVWFNWELTERQQRSLERRLRSAKLGHFKPLAEFDWDWPQHIDQQTIHELMQLTFFAEASNVILIGSNGVGKSTIAQNLAHQAVIEGHTALFITAANMLSDLAAQDGDNALRRRLKHYAQPDLLVIDEIGYLSYSNRHADLLFEIVNRRYEQRSTVITTNRVFSEWNEVFPNSACVVSLVDRLVHHSEILTIEGESYRIKEAKEQAEKRKPTRRGKN